MPNVTQIFALATGFLALAAPQARCEGVSVKAWGRMPDGREASLFTLTNSQGTRVQLSDFGALLVSVETRDRDGKRGKVTLSYESFKEALAGGVFGSVIGRFANRIDGGGFVIDGTRHDLASVNEKTGVHIHGGKTGFHRQLWSANMGSDEEGPFVAFSLESPDGHEGYPGTVQVTVTYTLTDKDVLRIEYEGSTDRATHLNLTNHAYFNLAGSGTVLDHRLMLDCETVLEIDDRKIPTGKRLLVAATPFDFREPKPVGDAIASVSDGGYDHCFVIAESRGEPELRTFARLSDPASGRFLEVATTKPGVQVYTANHFKGNPFPQWGGICFETQYFPDSPNRPDFPSSLIRPGEAYRHVTEFRFGADQE